MADPKVLAAIDHEYLLNLSGEHRWSGWPGAYCLNCGEADPAEAAVAHGCQSAICFYCGELWPQGPCHSYESPDRESHELSWKDCGQHLHTLCPAFLTPTPVEAAFLEVFFPGV